MNLENFVSQYRIADIFDISPRTLERWRINGYGPPFYRFGRRVYYNTDDVLGFLSNHKFNSTSEYA